MAAGRRVKEDGAENDLLSRIANDPAFGMSMDQLKGLMDAKNFIGCAEMQTEDYITEQVHPVLEENKDVIGITATINV